MAGSTVLNRFEQTPGPLGAADNKLVLEGTVESNGGVSLNTLRYNVTSADLDTDTVSVISPGFAGTITRIVASYNGAGTSGSVAIGVTIDSVPVTGSITLTSGNQFLIFEVVPSAANIFTASQSIQVITTGATPVAFNEGGITVEVLPS